MLIGKDFKVSSVYIPGTWKSVKYDLSDAVDYFEIDTHCKKFYDRKKNIAEVFQTFKKNLENVYSLNQRTKDVGFLLNEFNCLTLDEFTKTYTGFNNSIKQPALKKPTLYVPHPKVKPPAELDYEEELYIPETVRHQNGNRISYVTGALGTIEAQFARTLNGSLPKFSLQEAYDCDEYGSYEYGGLPHLVMKGLKQGLRVEGSSRNSELQYLKNCKRVNTSIVGKITSIIRMRVENEDHLRHALYEFGPLTVAIYVSDEIKHYSYGVLEPRDCYEYEPNHAVLLIGYGETDFGMPYWKFKNSWGTRWGEQGYGYLIRGSKACGIMSYVVTCTVKQYDPVDPESFEPSYEIPFKRPQAITYNDEQEDY